MLKDGVAKKTTTKRPLKCRQKDQNYVKKGPIFRSRNVPKKQKSKIISLVGKNDGYAYKHSDVAILMSSPETKYITPVSEAMQAVIWHALVSHPVLQKKKTKW